MNSERYPVLITNIGNLGVHSVLDNGFIQSSEVAPEVHSHTFYELLITTEGAIGIDIYSRSTLNEVYTVKKGSACILPSETYHCTRALTPDTEKPALRFCCIPSANPKVNDSALALYNRSLYKCSTPTVIEDCDSLYKKICEVRKELTSGKAASADYVQLLLGQIYIDLFRLLCADGAEVNNERDAEPTDDVENRRIEIEEYLFTHMNEQITENDLAEKMHLSKRQTSRIIRRLFNNSFRQLLIDMRLNRAAQLLIETDMSVEDIADAVGYSSLSGFHTAFGKKFSHSAAQYRKTFTNQ